MAIEIVDFPIKHGDFPSFFVSLPGRVTLPSTQPLGIRNAKHQAAHPPASGAVRDRRGPDPPWADPIGGEVLRGEVVSSQNILGLKYIPHIWYITEC